MLDEYLKNNNIRYIGKKPKKDNFKTNNILTIYHSGQIEKVL